MSRLTFRLPETLHRQLNALANREAVSLNQYIVFGLTRQVTFTYAVQPVSEEIRAEQQASFAQLLEKLGTATDVEIKQTLSQRPHASRKRKSAYKTKSVRPTQIRTKRKTRVRKNESN